jgi:hypothetical protein
VGFRSRTDTPSQEHTIIGSDTLIIEHKEQYRNENRQSRQDRSRCESSQDQSSQDQSSQDQSSQDQSSQDKSISVEAVIRQDIINQDKDTDELEKDKKSDKPIITQHTSEKNKEKEEQKDKATFDQPSPTHWEELFKTEPLKSVDLTEMKEQRSPQDVEKLCKFLAEYRDLLSDGTLDYKTDPTPKHTTTCEILTNLENPKIVSTHRHNSPEDQESSKKLIQQKLLEGVIEKSSAPWSSNSVLVKKDGKLRMVIDYRSLNKVTIRDSYPMPRIQDLTDSLAGTQWFTGVDCVQAFHQIPMANGRSKDLPTFRGPAGGLFRYRYMPMGLVNAMAIWSRFIDTVMQKYQHQCVLCYADDCLIYTKSDQVEDHIRDLEKVFKQLRKHGIKIKASKLKLGFKSMPFLGVVITKDGIIPNKDKTKAITELQYPKTLKQLRSVLGMFAYYRRFIPNFSERAAPLYAQTTKHCRNPKDKNGIILSDASKAAFEDLKTAITSEPIVLHYPDWEKPFEIHCDASKEAVAAILTQRIEGVEKVIMYASKTLNPVERNYHTYEQECLAVVWAVELFRGYIRNSKTVVLTDCSALQWLKTRTEGSRVMRWIMRLQEFDLEIRHRKGKKSSDVDGLTRDPAQNEEPYGEGQIERLYDTMRQKFDQGKKPMVLAATRVNKRKRQTQDSIQREKEKKTHTLTHTLTHTQTETDTESKNMQIQHDRDPMTHTLTHTLTHTNRNR